MAKIVITDKEIKEKLDSFEQIITVTGASRVDVKLGNPSQYHPIEFPVLIIGDDVKVIGSKSFGFGLHFKLAYIPSSVVTIGNKGIAATDIYLEGTKKPGYQDHYETTCEDSYAFDFHRGGVTSHVSSTVHDKCWYTGNVHENVSKEEFMEILKKFQEEAK